MSNPEHNLSGAEAVLSTDAEARVAEMARQAAEMPHDELAKAYAEVTVNHEARLAAMEARLPETEGVRIRAEKPIREWMSRNGRRVVALATIAFVGSGLVANSINNTENASAQAGKPAAPASAPQNKNNYKIGEDTKTVVEAVKELEFTTARGAFTKILNNPTDYDELTVSNYKNRQVSLKGFNERMSTADAAEGIALGIVNSPAKSADKLNALEGKDGETPRTDTHKQRIAKIAKIVSDKDTGFNGKFRMNGTWDNSSTDNETKALGSSPVRYNNVRALQIVPGSDTYKATYDKIGGGKGDEDTCLNEERKLKDSAPTSPKNHFKKTPPTEKKVTDTPTHEDRITPGEGGPVMVEDKPKTKKPVTKKPEDKKPEDKKPEDKKPEDKTPEDKKPEDKTPEVCTPPNPDCTTPPEEKPKDKTPVPTDHQSVPNAPGSGGSAEEGDDPQNDSDVDGYGPGDTVAPIPPTPAPAPVQQGDGTPANPIVNPNPTPVESTPVTPTPPAVPSTQTPGTPTTPNAPAEPAN